MGACPSERRWVGSRRASATHVTRWTSHRTGAWRMHGWAPRVMWSCECARSTGCGALGYRSAGWSATMTVRVTTTGSTCGWRPTARRRRVVAPQPHVYPSDRGRWHAHSHVRSPMSQLWSDPRAGYRCERRHVDGLWTRRGPVACSRHASDLHRASVACGAEQRGARGVRCVRHRAGSSGVGHIVCASAVGGRLMSMTTGPGGDVLHPPRPRRRGRLLRERTHARISHASFTHSLPHPERAASAG